MLEVYFAQHFKGLLHNLICSSKIFLLLHTEERLYVKKHWFVTKQIP